MLARAALMSSWVVSGSSTRTVNSHAHMCVVEGARMLSSTEAMAVADPKVTRADLDGVVATWLLGALQVP